MVVNNVHNYSDTCRVESLNHLLELSDSHLAIVRIGRIAALGNVIVLGIVAPVELRVGICLVYGRIIVHGKKMNVSDSKLNEVVNADRLTVLIGESPLCKRKILALVLRRRYFVREVTNVNLPDDGLGIAGNRLGSESVVFPIGRIGERKINDHSSVSVKSCRLCIWVNSLLSSNRRSYGIGIVSAMSAGLGIRPYATVALNHIYALVCLTLMARREEVENHLGCRRCPYLKGGLITVYYRTEIVTVIVIILGEILAVKDFGRYDRLLTVSLDRNTIGF